MCGAYVRVVKDIINRLQEVIDVISLATANKEREIRCLNSVTSIYLHRQGTRKHSRDVVSRVVRANPRNQNGDLVNQPQLAPPPPPSEELPQDK
jgi:hypothetical protein